MKKYISEYFNKLSIANRLAVMYALSGTFVLSIIILALYALQIIEISRYQKAEMKNRLSIIEHSMYNRKDYDSWEKLIKIIQDSQPTNDEIFVRIDSEDPQYRLDAPFTIAMRKLHKRGGFNYTKIKDRNFRIYSKKIPASGERPEVILSVAVDMHFYEKDDLALDIAFSVIFFLGICAITYIGRRIAQKSLKPVDELSQAVAQINPKNLQNRLPGNNLPQELTGFVLSFNDLLERLEEEYIKQSTFNSDVAHELRTPLGNMIGSTEVALSRSRSCAELEDVLQSNLEELERLRTIINDMLFLSRADQGELAVNLTRTSLAQTVRKSAEFLDVIFEEEEIELEIDGDATTSAEQSLLGRAITNLLDNAISHGTQGHPIKVEISSDENWAYICVINHSKPIDDNTLKYIFNRFYRVSKDRQNNGVNNHHGLGLSIVKAIAVMHGGNVSAKYEDGVIKICIALPLI